MEPVEMLVAAAAVLLLCYGGWLLTAAVIKQQRRLRILQRLPVNPKYHWLFGHLYYLPGPGEAGLKHIRDQMLEWDHGDDAVGMGLAYYGPWQHDVVMGHPETVRAILKSEPKPHWFGGYKAARPWLGDGLLISKGEKWARNRRLLTPAFHFDILKPYISVKNRAVELLMDKWTQKSQTAPYLEVFSDVSQCTLDIIMRCAFSYENDCQTRGEKHPYVKAVNQMGEACMNRCLKPWLYPDLLFYLSPSGREFRKNCEYVHTVSRDVIAKRKAALGSSAESPDRNHRYLDFLDILLTARDEDGVGLAHQEIQDEVDTFMFEGHDTTASAISWTLHELAKHPEHLERCRAEVDEVLRGRTEDDITWDDLSSFPHLTRCIKEAMRLRTPVPLIEREVTRDTEILGYTLPAGTVVDIIVYALHHNPAIWDNSTEYRPDRFLPENIEKMHPFSFLPFSAGPRNCIGQHFAMDELKILVGRIIHRFDLELDPKRPARMLMAMVMRTEDGMWIKVTPRSQSHAS